MKLVTKLVIYFKKNELKTNLVNEIKYITDNQHANSFLIIID